MGARTEVSVEEYLHASFSGVDSEYRDGEIVERAMPTYLHGRTQALVVAFFVSLRRQHSVFSSVETRMKLRDGLYLVPDVSVFWPTAPAGNVPDGPPLIAVEVLAPDDRMAEVRDKLQEYRDWGVRHVWLVDPHSRRLYACDRGLAEVDSFHVAELGIEVQPADIFD